MPTSETKFGKYPSLSAFLAAYKAAENKKRAKEIEAQAPSIAEKVKKIKKIQQKQRDVIEINAILAVKEPDDSDPAGGRHVRLRVKVKKIVKNDPDVKKDVDDAKATARDVFVAIRIGDAQGIQEKINGLKTGAELHLKGEWITREKAQAHGGEKMSVLHFTHHPLGFICTPVKCYT